MSRPCCTGKQQQLLPAWALTRVVCDHRPRPPPPLPPSPRGRKRPSTSPATKQAAPVAANELTTCGWMVRMGGQVEGGVKVTKGASVRSPKAQVQAGIAVAVGAPSLQAHCHTSAACLLLDLVHLLVDRRLQALCTRMVSTVAAPRCLDMHAGRGRGWCPWQLVRVESQASRDAKVVGNCKHSSAQPSRHVQPSSGWGAAAEALD